MTTDDVPLVDPEVDENFETVLEWADELRRLGVRTNADTPEDAKRAREFGAEGIGLCRTEHMFMAADRQPKMRAMIVADSDEERKEALAELLPLQQEDFEGLFEEMQGLPVTIRLLDPPLHEFLPVPHELEEGSDERRRAGGAAGDQPHAGHARGAAGHPAPGDQRDAGGRHGPRRARRSRSAAAPHPSWRSWSPWWPTRRSWPSCGRSSSGRWRTTTAATWSCRIGTMLELPRACFLADVIGEEADFFSFGTNDLTQTALGFSRDDAEGKFLDRYLEQKIIDRSPFETLDAPGVGQLVRMGAWLGRSRNKELGLGICGEHGGDPESIDFFHHSGLDYVSCSPFRVPIARVAAAQAAVAGGLVLYTPVRRP